MADGTELSTAQSPLQRAERLTGSIYVIDLIGFSKITEAEITDSTRSGTETVTRLVTELFGQLMDELANRDIRFGGFAGDALIAWQFNSSSVLSALELASISSAICQQVAPGISCRTATAQGAFWTADLTSSRKSRPITWGPSVRTAFARLASQPRKETSSSAISETGQPRDEKIMTTASVTDRWTMIVRALTPEACATATPEQLASLLQRTADICDAVGAEIDNIVQDDKGLLIIIVLAASRAQDMAQRDRLLDNLTAVRNPIAHEQDVTSAFGTIFRCRPDLAGTPVRITIGESINQSAKALILANTSPTQDAPRLRALLPPSKQNMIGREQDAQRLWRAYLTSRQRRHTCALTAPAGVGKSTLVQNLSAQLDEPSALVEATPGSRLLPFGCAQDLAEYCGLKADAVFQADGQTELARRLPPVIIIENWQWCDADSKRLIRRLQQSRDQGFLLITSRSNVEDLVTETELHIGPLNFEQSDTLIETLAPGLLDKHKKQSIFDITSGTPFWLVQAALHYSQPDAGSETLSSGTALDGLLAARGRHLSEPATALWRLYCAWRLPLDLGVARELLTKFDIEISPSHFEEIDQLGWIVPEGSPQGEVYRPAHDILADWGASDLPVTFERALNGAIARAVTKSNGSPSRIARHWQIAGRDLRAAIWYDRAAKNADRAGTHSLAIAHLEQSNRLSQTAQTTHKVKDLEHLALSATAHWGVGKLRRAKQILAEFDELAKTVPKSPAKRAALSRAATIQSEVGQFAGNSGLILTGMLRGWRNSGQTDSGHEVKARRQGFIFYALGLLQLPVEGRLNRLIGQAQEAGEYRSQTLIGCSAATLHMIRCKWQKADAVLTSCNTAIAQTDDRQMLGVAQTLLGLCHLYQGKAETAYDWFEHVAETGRDQDHQMFKVWGAYAKAEACLYDGELEQAKDLALEARAVSRGLGDHQSACIIEGVLAQVYLAQASYRFARKHARNAARFAAKLPPTNFSTLEGIAAPAQVGAELRRRTGETDPELEGMIQTGRNALRSYAKVFKVAQPRRHYVEGLCAQAGSDLRSARRHFRKAQTTSATLGMQYEQRLSASALHAIEEKPDGASTAIY